jgi:hypothetical protein
MSNMENIGPASMAKETSEIECALPEVATANGEQQSDSTARNLILQIS